MDIPIDPDLDDPPPPSRLRGHALEQEALMMLHRFGWLRAREIGALLYPHSSQPRTLAERLMRRLVEKRQVFARPLQTASGAKFAQAYLLGMPGADRLWQELGVDAWTGKDISIASTWMHDLIATQILVRWKNKGFQIVTERELHRKTCSGMKIPDGLAKPHGDNWIWLEVERSRKSGPAMRKQADYLASAALGMNWLGFSFSHAVVAYPKTQGVDHRLRNISALIKLDIPSSFTIHFLPLEIHPLTLVAKIGKVESVTIKP